MGMRLAIGAIVMAQVAPGATIGVAAPARDGQVCVAMPASDAPPASVTLIEPSLPHAIRVATIVRPVDSCEPLERALIPGPYYAVHVPRSADTEARVWLALPGRVATRRTPSGVFTVQLGPPYPDAQVRSCTSREGLHLTVWAGAPLKSPRLWHSYYYLGYDVEPSCENGDVRK